MLKNSFIVSLVMILCLLSCENKAQNSGNDYNSTLIQSLEKTVEQEMEANNIPAVAVGVIKDGKIMYTNGFGVQQRDSEMLVDQHIIFQIASVSKMFTGIIVNNLVNEGKLDLQAKIINYLKDDLNSKAKEELASITLAQLMQHTAGIPNYACSVYPKSKKNGFYWKDGYDKDEFLADINTIELDFTAGSNQSYSNSGYNLVGFVCEKQTGLFYAELLQKYITHPYALTNTFVVPVDNQISQIAIPYLPHEPMQATSYSDWGKATPASGIFSSIYDLMQLMQMQMSAYGEKSKSGFHSLVLTEHPQLDHHLDFQYYLGLFLREGPSGLNLYQHDGDADGYMIFYTFSPEKNIGKVMVTSCGGEWFIELDRKIEDLLFK